MVLVYKIRLLLFMWEVFPSSGTFGAGTIDPRASTTEDIEKLV